MPVFSWELAEALALAHMKQMGFFDARSTAQGSDGGLDVVSAKAAAQVKAWSKPVGAPEIQKLKGAAHSYQHVVFYSQAGYTAQAVAYASTAQICLFTFTEANQVAAFNEAAMVLESDDSRALEAQKAAASIRKAETTIHGMTAFLSTVLNWVKLSPFLHIVPQEYQDARVPSLSAAVLASSNLNLLSGADLLRSNPLKGAQFSENVDNIVEECVLSIGRSLDVDVIGLAPSEAAEAFLATLQGETSRLRIGELRPGLASTFGGNVAGAWQFLLPVIASVVRTQKFLKAANAEKRRIENEHSLSFKDDSRTKEEFARLRDATQSYQLWSNGIIESGHGNSLQGERLFLDVAESYSAVLSQFGTDGSKILVLSDSRPASWLDEEDGDEP